jgi:hypothetical protein
MRRRESIAGFGSAAAAASISRPLLAHAQQGGRVRRISRLSGNSGFFLTGPMTSAVSPRETLAGVR